MMAKRPTAAQKAAKDYLDEAGWGEAEPIGSDDFRRYPTEEEAAADMAAVERLIARYDAEAKQWAAEWESQYGKPYPRTIQDWQRWAVRVGCSGERALTCDFTKDELLPLIEGHLLAIRDRRDHPVAGDGDHAGRWEEQAIAYFLVQVKKRPPSEIKLSEIRAKLGCHKSTLSKGRAPKLHDLISAYRSQSTGHRIRRGSKTATGDLEAMD